MRSAYISVSDDTGIGDFRRWLESQGFTVYEGDPDLEEDYNVVVVNLPFDVPYSERPLLESFRGKQAYTLLKAVQNYRESIPISDPEDYERIIKAFETCGDVPLHDRRKLAVKALLHLLSFFARIHSRMAELFAMLDFEHRIYEVVDRIFMGETVEEVLLDSLSPIHNVVPVRNLPIYLSIFNEIPSGSYVVLKRNTPIDAGYDLESAKSGDVLVYKGKFHGRSGYDIVVAEDGPEGIVKVRSTSEDVFMIGSSGIFLKWERTFEKMTDLERLAHAFVAFSPTPTSSVFNENEGLVAFKRDFEESPDLLDVPSGDVLALNFELSECPRESYSSIVVPSVSEVVRGCLRSSRLVLRRF